MEMVIKYDFSATGETMLRCTNVVIVSFLIDAVSMAIAILNQKGQTEA